MQELRDLFKQIGFWHTIKLLDGEPQTRRQFYDELNKFSYYNSFFRVKTVLIDLGLIEINAETKDLSLTEKGHEFVNKMKELNKMIEVET